MLQYPNIDPVIVSIGPLSIHWYGVMYIFGFVMAWILAAVRCVRRPDSPIKLEQISDIIFYGAMGVILGGRIGYVLFYVWPDFVQDPLMIIRVWQGGMSFHGGLIGVILALWLYSYRHQCSLIDLTDFFAPMIPIGLAAGRLGNFINGELWGRITTSRIGMVFPNGGPLPRYPSQLIEMCLEGILLFVFLWVYSRKPRPKMMMSAVFLIGYGMLRFIAEFFREPDPQLGFVAFGWMTQGQLLCIPMILLGMFLFWLIQKRRDQTKA